MIATMAGVSRAPEGFSTAPRIVWPLTGLMTFGCHSGNLLVLGKRLGGLSISRLDRRGRTRQSSLCTLTAFKSYYLSRILSVCACQEERSRGEGFFFLQLTVVRLHDSRWFFGRLDASRNT